MGLKDAGKGVLQLITDFDDVEQEFANFEHMMRASGRPLSLSLAESLGGDWRGVLARIEDANNRGMTVRAQVAPRHVRRARREWRHVRKLAARGGSALRLPRRSPAPGGHMRSRVQFAAPLQPFPSP